MNLRRSVTDPRTAWSGTLGFRVVAAAPSAPPSRSIEMRLVADEAHYQEVVRHGILTAKTSVWIATANLKDAHVESPLGTTARARGRYCSLFEWLEHGFARGLDVRVLHASKASRALVAKAAWKRAGKMCRICPRVHLKMIAIDGRLLYIGSANFTGAGIGAKSIGRRNFEVGMLTDDPLLLDEMQALFDDIWTGKRCGGCRLRSHCPAPLDGINA